MPPRETLDALAQEKDCFAGKRVDRHRQLDRFGELPRSKRSSTTQASAIVRDRFPNIDPAPCRIRFAHKTR
jgi:hypothetical protein